MFSPGWTEMVVLGVIALLLFGKRLPEVARSLGQSFVEFKRGMTNIETDLRSTVYNDPAATSTPGSGKSRIEEDLRPSSEKFEDSSSESDSKSDSDSKSEGEAAADSDENREEG